MHITFQPPTGEVIKPIHGLCNGPVSYGGLTDLSAEYREIGVPYVRLHDTDWPFPQVVDIYQIFRDFSKDENDPANYDFTLTDQYIAAIDKVNAGIIFRLGTSIEHLPNRRYVYAPANNQKWARVAAHIIMHYNEGWASGYHYGIRRWELWNEPEDSDGARQQMWIGTKEQYFALYDTVSRYLKDQFGDRISVGGYASCGFYGILPGGKGDSDGFVSYFKDFIAYISSHGCTLDFFSYHYYGIDDTVQPLFASYVRQALDEAGYSHAEIIVDEWNYRFSSVQDFLDMKNMVGARYVGRMFCAFQDSRVDIATYYDGQPHMKWCGLFSRELLKQKPYFVFLLFGKLYALKYRLPLTLDCKSFTGLAAEDHNRRGLFLINDGEDAPFLLPGDGYQAANLYLVDDHHDGTMQTLPLLNDSFPMMVPARSVLYIEMLK